MRAPPMAWTTTSSPMPGSARSCRGWRQRWTLHEEVGMSEGSVRRHPSRGAGYAEVRLPNAAAAVEDPRFRLFWEPHHNPYLGPQGWQAAEATLHPEEVTTEGRDLVM